MTHLTSQKLKVLELREQAGCWCDELVQWQIDSVNDSSQVFGVSGAYQAFGIYAAASACTTCEQASGQKLLRLQPCNRGYPKAEAQS